MVAIVTSSGVGIQRDSAVALGAQGQLGTAALGQNGSGVTVNATNGNLVIQSQDEMLFGTGLDDIVINTYNSRDSSAPNGWRESFQCRVGALNGTVNTAGSNITHYTADSSVVLYTYNTTKACYVGNELGGAYDTLSFNSATNQWTWREGKTRATEVYDNANSGRLIQSTDASGNTLAYTYTGTLLTKISTVSGDYTSFVYTGSLLTSIVTSYTNASGLQTATRTYYGYDASSRLTTVTTDLSPGDNSISDGKTYVTTYGYSGTGKLINSITQSDGTSVTIGYDSSSRVTSITQAVSAGASKMTSLVYGANRTTVIDPQGDLTTFIYDTKGQLTQLISPPPATGGLAQISAFGYDANGNVVYSGPGGDPNFANIGLNWNDLDISAAGVSTTQTVEVDGGVSVYRRQTQSVPSAGWTMNLGQTGAGLTAVTAGQTVQFNVYAASSGASQLTLYAKWLDASGNSLGMTQVNTIPTGGVLGLSGVALANPGRGLATAVTGAAFVELLVQATASGTGPMSVAIAQPSVTYVTNVVWDPQFAGLATNWADQWQSDLSIATTQTTEVNSGVNVYRRQTTTTPPAGFSMSLGQGSFPANLASPVTAGQLYEYSAYVAAANSNGVHVGVDWYDSSRNFVGTTEFGNVTGGSFANGLSSANFVTGYIVAPTGAAYASFDMSATANGQGPFSIAFAEPVFQAVPANNALLDPLFTNPVVAWNDLWQLNTSVTTTQVIENDGGVAVYRRQTQTTPASGWAMDVAGQTQSAVTAMPVTPGQRLEASAYVTGINTSHVDVDVNWYDVNFNLLSSSVAGTVSGGGAFGSGGTAGSNRTGGFVTAPTGAAYATFRVSATANGSGLMNVAVGQPILRVATSGQTVLTQFTADMAGAAYLSGNSLGVRDPNFGTIALTWGDLGTSSNAVPTTQTTEIDGGVNVYRRQTATTPQAGWTMNLGQSGSALTAVIPGQTVKMSVSAASSGASALNLYAKWLDASGNVLGMTLVSPVATGGVLGSSGAVGANRCRGFATAIAGAAFVELMVQATASGSGVLNVAIAQPTVEIATNLVWDPQFTNVGTDWVDQWQSDVSVATVRWANMEGGVKTYRRQTQNTPPAGFTMSLGQGSYPSNLAVQVTAGQAYQYSAYVASSNSSGVQVGVAWYDSSHNFIGISEYGSVTGGSFANGVNGANYLTGYLRAPANAAYASFDMSATANGLGTFSIAVAEPVFQALPANNALLDPQFTNSAVTWNDLTKQDNSIATSQWVENNGGTNVYRRQTQTTPAVGWAMDVAGQTPSAVTALPVVAGQTLEVSAYVAASNAQSVQVGVSWYDVNFNLISSSSAASAGNGGSYSNGTASANRIGGFVTAPAGAVYASYRVWAAASGAGALNVAVAQPVMRVASAGQTVLTAFSADMIGAAFTPGALSGTIYVPPVPSYVYTYDSNGNRLTMTDALGNRTDYAYDGNNQLLSKTEAANGSAPLKTRYVYDSNSRLVYLITPNGDVTQYVYNANGTQKSLIRYTGSFYTTTGTPTSSAMDTWVTSTDRTQTLRTDTTYDARGLVSTVTTYGETNSDGTGKASTASVTTCVYDQAGRLLSRQLSGASATESYIYDGLGRVTKVTDYNGKITQTLYTDSASGLQSATTLANGTTRTSVYDRAGELVSVTNTGGTLTATTAYAYDSVGNLIRTTDATGLSTYFVYDGKGRKVADVAADGSLIVYTYNASDQVVGMAQYATKLTAAQLSLLTNETVSTALLTLASVIPAASANDRWSWNVYDADGRLAETIDAQGYATVYTYDAAGRVVAQTEYATALAPSVLIRLQAVPPSGLILPAADAVNDRTTRNFYNGDDQLTGTLDADGYLTEIVYDAAGRKVRTIAYATKTNSAYWAAGTFAQLSSGLSSGENAGDDIYHWWVYDNRGLLRAEIDGEGNATRYDNYTAAGYAGTVTRGQVIAAAGLISAPPTFAGLPAPTGALEVTSYTYDAYGHVLTRGLTLTGGAVETTTYVYDATYNLVSQGTASSSSATGGADGRTGLFGYDALGRKVAELTGNGVAALAALGGSPTQAQINAVWASNQISYAYDTADRLISQTDPEGRRTLFYYDADGRLTYQIDGTGGVTQHAYDAFGEKTDVTTYTNRIAASTLATMTGGKDTTIPANAITASATDNHTHVDYNGNGTVADTVDALGALTRYGYNAFGDVTSRIDPLLAGVTTRTLKTYNRRGLLLDSTADADSLALKTSYQYDAFGRTTQVTDPQTNTQKWFYYHTGQVKSEVDGLNHTTGYTYDSFGRVLTATDRNGKPTQYAYGLFDRQITVTDPNSIVTTTLKNAYGQTVKTFDGTTTAATFEYDADGNMVRRIVDSGGLQLTTQWTYDKTGRAVTETSPAGSITRSVYDAAGRLAFVIDPVGAVTGYAYDSGGRVTRTQDYATAFTASGTQTLAQMQAWATSYANANDLISSASYDAGGRLSYTIDAYGYIVGYAYDSQDRVVQQVRYPANTSSSPVPAAPPAGSEIVRTVYDAAGRQAFVIDGLGAVTGYTYDKDGRVTQTLQYAAKNTSSGVQTLAQMQEWLVANAANPGNLTSLASYDANGRLLYTVDPANSVTGYLYDDEGRVVQKTRYAAGTSWSPLPATPPAKSEIVRYAYDAAGRQAFVIDPVGAVTGYTYDNDGNVTTTVRYATLNTAAGVQSLAQMQAWLSANSNAIANNVDNRLTWNTYDTAGRLATTTDSAGYVTGYSYDADSRVVREVRYPLGVSATSLPPTLPAAALVTNIAYDAAGRKTFVTDPTGAVTRYSYDTFGNVWQTVRYTALNSNTAVQSLTQMNSWVSNNANASDRTTSATYDKNGRLDTSTDALGYKTKYDYDPAGRLKTKTEYKNVAATTWRTTSYKYDAAGNLTDVTDPLLIVTHREYDTFGRVTLETVAYHTSDAATTTFAYYSDGRLKNQTVAFGTLDAVTTSREYDAQGRVTKTTDGNGKNTVYTYDDAGQLKTTTDPTNAVTTNTYNAFGEVTSVKDPNGNTGYFYYDKRGRQTMAVDAEGYATAKSYDMNDKVTIVTRYATKIIGAGISATPPAVTTDAKDNTTSFGYDNAGRVLASADGNNYATSYHYNAFGDRDWMQNALGAITNYYYDKSGQLTSQVTPASSVLIGGTPIAPAVTTAYEYDAFGNRTKMVEAQGRTEQRTTTYTYDDDNRLTQQIGDAVTVTLNGVTSPNTPTQVFDYDKRGNQVSARDANGAFTVTYYDAQDRKALQVDALGTLTAWAYDGNGNVSSQKVYGDAVAVPVSAATRPTPVNTNNCRETRYTYDLDNRLATTSIIGVKTGAWDGSTWATQTGDLTTRTDYDLNGNAIKQTDANGNATYFWYDKLGRKTCQVDAGGYMTKWTLDAEGNAWQQTQYAAKLTGTITAGGSAPSAPAAPPAGQDQDRVTEFTYDHNGQRLTETRNGVTYNTVDSVTGVLSSASTANSSITFEYNAIGQVTKKTEASGDITSYVYDNLGRLSQLVTQYTANSAAAKLVTQYTYDGLGNVLTTVAGFGQGGKTETTTYTYGAGGRLATKQDAENFVISYGYDANGNTTFQYYKRTTSYNTTAWEADGTTYDAMGRVLSTFKLSKPGTNWIVGDTTTDAYYNAYGEVIARGTNTGGNINNAQEFADFDAAGRVWRSNSDGGATKVYAYDKTGNMTLQMQSAGTTDLRNLADLTAALGSSGVTRTYNVYDSRNELVAVKRPNSLTANGTYTSASDVSVAPTTANVVQTDYGASGSTYSTNVQVLLSAASITQVAGGGDIHVTIDIFGGGYIKDQSDGTIHYSTKMVDRPVGTTFLASQTIYWPYSNNTYNNTSAYYYTVKITQTVGATTVTLQDTTQYSMQPLARDPVTSTKAVGSALQIQGMDSLASVVKLYARQSGSGNYTLVNSGSSSSMSPLYDADGNLISGAFVYNFNQPPFNTATGNWDIVYQATDASGRVVEAKSGTLTFAFAGATPTAGSFGDIPAFTATAQSGGLWQLGNNTGPAAYIDSSQTFNAFGDIRSQTDGNGNQTTFFYNALGNLIQKNAATVTVVSENGAGSSGTPTDYYYYDKSGRQIGHRDPNANLTTQTLLAGSGYDGKEGLTVNQFNFAPTAVNYSSVVKNEYDIFGNLHQVTDAINVVTVNDYDGDNRLVKVTHPTRADGVTKLVDTYVYDEFGHRIRHTNNIQTGLAETTEYDLQGRISKTVTFGGQTTNYTYTWTAGTAAARATAGQANAGSWTRATAAWGKTSSDVTDYFGKVLSSSDFGAHTIGYTYNLTGQLKQQAISGSGYLDYTYTAAGQIATITDSAHRDYASTAKAVADSDVAAAATVTMKSVYAYDNNGNRVRETYFKVGSGAMFVENASITYDALNRVTEYKDGKTDITYSYDANGNRRNVRSEYRIKGGTTTTSDWYTYDNMNRFVRTGGALSNGSITGGVIIAYNARGDRMSATYGYDGHKESYTYSADGYLETVSVATLTNGVLGADVLRVVRTNDALGRTTKYEEKKDDGVATLLTRQMTYDDDGRVKDETDITNGTNNGSAVKYQSEIHNDYKLLVGGAYTGQDIGVLTHTETTQYQNDIRTGTTATTYDYVWWGSAKAATVTASGLTTGSSVYSYDAEGYLYKLEDTGISRKLFYQTDMFGQVLSRKEWNISGQGGNYISGAGRDFFYLNEHAIGDIGTDTLVNRQDYVQQLAADTTGSNNVTNAYVSATPVSPNPLANIDINYEAYNASTVDQSSASFTALGGETLRDIAQNLWGDASLWYIIADANGLTASSTLTAGQILRIPSKPTNIHNNATTFKAYDPADTLGNTRPTQPQPPARDDGCGIVGQMVVVMIAVVVTAIVAPQMMAAIATQESAAAAAATGSVAVTYTAATVTAADVSLGGIVLAGATAGFAGGVASQTFAVMSGIQSQFDWKAVATGTIAGAVGGAFGKIIDGTGLAEALERGIAGNIVTQGVGIATGLQKKFDWTSVAVAGAVAAVSYGVNKALNPTKIVSGEGYLPSYATSHLVDPVTNRILTGTAALLAGAATRTALTHDSFGKSLMSALPDAIGQTIGEIIADGIQTARTSTVKATANSIDGRTASGSVAFASGNRYFISPADAQMQDAFGQDTLMGGSGNDIIGGRKYRYYKNSDNGKSVDIYYEDFDGSEKKTTAFIPGDLTKSVDKIVGTDGGIAYVAPNDGKVLDRLAVVPFQSIVDNLPVHTPAPAITGNTALSVKAPVDDGGFDSYELAASSTTTVNYAMPTLPTVAVVSASNGGINPVDDMGQPLYGRSHYNGDIALSGIISNAKNVPLTATAGRLWRWFNYTTPDAKQRREESSWVNPRLAQLDQLASSPFGALGYDVAMVSGADERTKQFALDMGSSFEGLVAAGALSYRSVRIQQTIAAIDAPVAYGTPYRQLSSNARSALLAKVENRTITREEWKRLQWNDRLTVRRTEGVDGFWAMERQNLSQGLPGSRNWSPEAAESILNGGTPRGIFAHHKYSVSQYPQLANDPFNIAPVTYREHLYDWHGGSWGNPSHGLPLNPTPESDF